MKPPGSDVTRYTTLVDTRRRELLDRHDTVLSPRDQRNPSIGRGTFLSHGERKAPHGAFSPRTPRDLPAPRI
jgi:hypothetical protein